MHSLPCLLIQSACPPASLRERAGRQASFDPKGDRLICPMRLQPIRQIKSLSMMIRLAA